MSESSITYVPASVAESAPNVVVALQNAGVTVVIGEPPVNGQVTEVVAPEVADAPEVEGWVNVAGYPCTNQFLAYISSLHIVKHLRGTCKCASNHPEKCAAASRYGYTAEQLGSDPSAEVPANLIKES